MNVQDIEQISKELLNEVQKSFVGEDAFIHLSIIGLLSGLHVLIEDIPGVGKTTLAIALSQASGLSFSRIQFTPDMLPQDVLGMNIWDPLLRDFIYKPGPVHANIILADELNRTSARTQSAFLEAMQDAQVTIDGKTRLLPQPFFLIATENPHSFLGTFALPEAELDRFGISFSLGYPSQENEAEILRRKTSPHEQTQCTTVCDSAKITNARTLIRSIHVSDLVRDYIVKIVRITRQHEYIRMGASPRAALCLQLAAKAMAASRGRDFVLAEDVEYLAPSVLAHRIVLSSRAKIDQINASSCVKALCAKIPKPTGL